MPKASLNKKSSWSLADHWPHQFRQHTGTPCQTGRIIVTPILEWDSPIIRATVQWKSTVAVPKMTNFEGKKRWGHFSPTVNLEFKI